MSRTIHITDDNNSGTTLFDYRWNDLGGQGDRALVGNARLTRSATEIATLTCDIYPQMVAANGYTGGQILANCTPYKSYMQAYITPANSDDDVDELNGVYFGGRIMQIAPQMDSDGVYFYRVTAEGMEAQLLDVCFDNSDYLDPTQGNVDEEGYVDSADYMQWLIDQYNASDQVTGGNLSPLTTRASFLGSDPIAISKPYKATMTAAGVILDEMRNIVDKCGGGLLFWYTDEYDQVGWEFAVTWDTHDMLKRSPYPIEATLGESLESCMVQRDYADIVNRVRVVGSTYTETFPVESNNNNEEDEEETLSVVHYVSGKAYFDALTAAQKAELFDGVTIDYEITSDNELYIYNPSSVDTYGAITRGMQITGYDEGAELEEQQDGSKTFDHIDIDSDAAAKFMQEAIDYINEHGEPDVSVDVDIVDPHIVVPDSGVGTPQIYDDLHVDNELINLDETFMICAVTYDMCDPIRDSIEVGTKRRETGTSTLARAVNSIKSLEDSKLDKTAATTGKLGGVKTDGETNWTDPDGTLHCSGGSEPTDMMQYIVNGTLVAAKHGSSGSPRDLFYMSANMQNWIGFRSTNRSIDGGVGVNGLIIPGRTNVDIGVAVYYAGIVYWHTYCDAYGRAMEGLLTHPRLFYSNVYTNLKTKASNHTLTWADVEPFARLGIIAFKPRARQAVSSNAPFYIHQPYVLTDVMFDSTCCITNISGHQTSSVHGDTPIVCNGTSWEYCFETLGVVSHPKLGWVNCMFVVVRAQANVTNYTSDPFKIIGNDSFALRWNGVQVDNTPPSYMNLDGTANKAGAPTAMVSFSGDWQDLHSMDYWGHSIALGGPQAKNGYFASNYGIDIDTGAEVSLSPQYCDYRPQYA